MTAAATDRPGADAPMTLPLIAGALQVLVVLAAGDQNWLDLMSALAMLPIGLSWLWAYRRSPSETSGLYGLDSLAARWALLMALPALGAVLMAGRVLGLSPMLWLCGAGIGGVLCVIVLRIAPPVAKTGAVIAVLVAGAAYGYGVLAGLDAVLDAAPPRLESAQVTDLTATTTRFYPRYSAGLSTATGRRDYAVTPQVFDTLHVGGPACIAHHSGALDFAWWQVETCR